MSERASLEFGGTDEELAKYLGEAAKAFGGWAMRHPKTGEYRLVMGSILSLNPNDIRWEAVLRREGRVLAVESRSMALPWTRKKIARLVAFRQGQLVDFLEVKLRGGLSDKFLEPAARRPFATLGATASEVTASFAWLIASTAMCGLFAWLATLLAGLILADVEIREIARRAELLRRLGAVSLPSAAELASIGFGFRLGIAALFAAPLAFFTGSLLGVGHVIGEIWPRLSRLPFWLFVFLAILHGLAFARPLPAYAGVPCALLVPIAAHAGYALVWGRKKERRRALTPHPRARLVAGVGAIMGVAVLLAIIPRPRSGEDVVTGLVGFRDRALLGNGAGRALARFYYRTTLYVAEPMKEFYDPDTPDHRGYGRSLRTALYLDGDPAIERHLKALGFAVGTRPESSKGYDLVVESENGQVSGDNVVRVKPGETREELHSAAIEASRKSFRAGALRELSQVSWLAVFYFGPFGALAGLTFVYLVCVSLLLRKLSRRAALAATAMLFALSIMGLLFVLSGTGGSIEVVRAVRAAASPDALTAPLADPQAAVRYEAVRRFYDFLSDPTQRRPDYLVPLVMATRDDDLRVKIWACGALARLGDIRAIPALLEALRDPELFVRYRAAEALGRLRAAAAVGPLLEMIEKDNWYAGIYALDALRHIESGRF